MARELEDARRRSPNEEVSPAEVKTDGQPVAEPAAGADENVTSLSSARLTK
jgi:hypothetical protein